MYVCLGRICTIFPGCFSLLQPHACFLLMVQFLSVLLPPLLFSPNCWDRLFLKLEEAILESPLPLLDHSSLQDCIPRVFQADSWTGQSLLSQSPALLILLFPLFPSFQAHRHHHLATDSALPSLYICSCCSLFSRTMSSKATLLIDSSHVSGCWEQQTPETSWIAHAWMSCPYSRYGSGRSPLWGSEPANVRLLEQKKASSALSTTSFHLRHS